MAHPRKAGDVKMPTCAEEPQESKSETRTRGRRRKSAALIYKDSTSEAAAISNDEEIGEGEPDMKPSQAAEQRDSDMITSPSEAAIAEHTATAPRKRGRPPKSPRNVVEQCADDKGLNLPGNLENQVSDNIVAECSTQSQRNTCTSHASQSAMDTESDNCSQEEGTLDKNNPSSCAGDSCTNIFTTESEMDCPSSNEPLAVSHIPEQQRRKRGRPRKSDVFESPTVTDEQVDQMQPLHKEYPDGGETTLLSPVTRKRGRPKNSSQTLQSSQGEDSTTSISSPEPTRPFWCMKSPPVTQGIEASPTVTRKRGRPPKSPRNVEYSGDDIASDTPENITTTMNKPGETFSNPMHRIEGKATQSLMSPVTRKRGRPKKSIHTSFSGQSLSEDSDFMSPGRNDNGHIHVCGSSDMPGTALSQGRRETTMSSPDYTRLFSPFKSPQMPQSVSLAHKSPLTHPVAVPRKRGRPPKSPRNVEDGSGDRVLYTPASLTRLYSSEMSTSRDQEVSVKEENHSGQTGFLTTDSEMECPSSEDLGSPTMSIKKRKRGRPRKNDLSRSPYATDEQIDQFAGGICSVRGETATTSLGTETQLPPMNSPPTSKSEKSLVNKSDIIQERNKQSDNAASKSAELQSRLMESLNSQSEETSLKVTEGERRKICVTEGKTDKLDSDEEGEVIRKRRGRPRKVNPLDSPPGLDAQVDDRTREDNSKCSKDDHNQGDTTLEIAVQLSEPAVGSRKRVGGILKKGRVGKYELQKSRSSLRKTRKNEYLSSASSENDKKASRLSEKMHNDLNLEAECANVAFNSKQKEVEINKRNTHKSGIPRKLLKCGVVAAREINSDMKCEITGAITSTPKTVKKHRGRPRKSGSITNIDISGVGLLKDGVGQDNELGSSFISASLGETPGKRKRGRPRKCDVASPSPVQSPRGRGRGRPPKKKGRGWPAARGKTPVIQYTCTSSLSSSSRGGRRKCSSRGAGRGKSSQLRQSSFRESDTDESFDLSRHSKSVGDRPGSSAKRRGRPPIKKPSPADQSIDEKGEFQCLRCEEILTSKSKMKRHMMYTHQAVWTPETPEGKTDSVAIRAVFKVVKKLYCPTCKKTMNSITGYIHHQEWCGREDEMYTCEICGRYLKAMWRKVHMREHRQKLRKADELIKAEATSFLEDGNEELTHSGHVQRRAAKRALKHLKDVKEALTFEEGSKKKRKKTDVSDDEASVQESSNDDEEDEHDDEDEVDIEFKGTRRRKPSRRSNKPQKSGPPEKDSFDQNWLWHKELWEKPVFSQIYPRTSDWTWLSDVQASKYLPQTRESTRISITEQDETSSTSDAAPLQLFDCAPLQSETSCPAFFVGGPVWAISWCPTSPSANGRQYAAISCHMTMGEEHRVHESFIGPGLVQIWDFGHLTVDSESVMPVLGLGLAHDYGCVYGVSWCPATGPDREPADSEDMKSEDLVRCIGLLALACSDGTVRIHSVPNPSEVKKREDCLFPIMKLRPVFTLQPHFRNTANSYGCCMCVDWHPHGDKSLILAGYATGFVCIWDLTNESPLLRTTTAEGLLEIFPFHSFVANTLKIGCCEWSPALPEYFVTGNTDKWMNIWDMRDTSRPVLGDKFSSITSVRWMRTWNTPLCALDDCFLVGHGGILTLDIWGKEALMKQYVLYGDLGCIWDMDFSPWLHILTLCNNAGSVIGLRLNNHFRYLRKNFKKTRTSKRFFLYQADLVPNPGLTAGQEQSFDTGQKKSTNSCSFTQSSDNINVNEQKILGTSPNVETAAPTDSVVTGQHNSDADQTLHGETNGSAEQLKNNRRQSDHSYAQVNGSRSSYAEVKDKYCLVYRDNSLQKPDEVIYDPRLTNFKVLGAHAAEQHRQFPLSAIHKVRYSPNAVSCSWVLTGGQAGIVRLQNLAGLLSPTGRRILHKSGLL